jgi:alpha-1,4-galacturonosyltransferase
MRRRAPEYRRPSRRRLPAWIWCLLGIFLLVGLMLFVQHHNQKEQFRPLVVVSASNFDFVLLWKDHCFILAAEELLRSLFFLGVFCLSSV